jgi:threonine dehydrogenase-like Zn-dependent dehydrogenase
MVARTSGARTIVVYPLENRRKIALKYGADAVVDPTVDDVKEQIMK